MPDIDDFFDGAGERRLSGSAALTKKGDRVEGTVVDQFKIPYVPFGKTDPARDERTGEVIEQLVIVLETSLRNWEGVSRVPKVKDDKGNDVDADKDADEGFRAVYVRPYVNLHAALGEALKAAAKKAGKDKVRLENGGTLKVGIVDLQDVGKGNPKKVHKALYEPPTQQAAAEDFFSSSSAKSDGDEPPF